MDFHDRRSGKVVNVNDPAQFKTPKEQVEETALHIGMRGVRDPHTGIVHVDLSDPNHTFWKKMGD
jgi:hypothetical protein|tara:strand:+ start:1563 stop:1757 length:195 start_codon:yes stop_codon:yes gene_type:complete